MFLPPSQLNSEIVANRPAVRDAASETTVICVLMDGPAVSLKRIAYSVTNDRCFMGNRAFPPSLPASTYFFALSQVPPALPISSARSAAQYVAHEETADRMDAADESDRKCYGYCYQSGRYQFTEERPVAMSMHLSHSGRTPSLPSLSPGISSNWRWISPPCRAFLSTLAISMAEDCRDSHTYYHTEEHHGIHATSNPVSNSSPCSASAAFASAMYAPSSAMTVSLAAPTAKPFVMALRCFRHRRGHR